MQMSASAVRVQTAATGFDAVASVWEVAKAEEDSHSRRHLKPLYPSSEAPPPRTPNEAAPARRRHGNREPASQW